MISNRRIILLKKLISNVSIQTEQLNMEQQKRTVVFDCGLRTRIYVYNLYTTFNIQFIRTNTLRLNS